MTRNGRGRVDISPPSTFKNHLTPKLWSPLDTGRTVVSRALPPSETREEWSYVDVIVPGTVDRDIRLDSVSTCRERVELRTPEVL